MIEAQTPLKSYNEYVLLVVYSISFLESCYGCNSWTFSLFV